MERRETKEGRRKIDMKLKMKIREEQARIYNSNNMKKDVNDWEKETE